MPLSIGPDPNGTSRTYATFEGIQASLSNPYFGTECTTSVSGEPSANETELLAITPKLLRRRAVTLRYAGSTNRDGIAYRWSTTFRLKRVR